MIARDSRHLPMTWGSPCLCHAKPLTDVPTHHVHAMCVRSHVADIHSHAHSLAALSTLLTYGFWEILCSSQLNTPLACTVVLGHHPYDGKSAIYSAFPCTFSRCSLYTIDLWVLGNCSVHPDSTQHVNALWFWDTIHMMNNQPYSATACNACQASVESNLHMMALPA